MENLDGKCVVLGVTGGIAAYKMANVASALRKAGADVHVIMTENATQFITPLTFETLTNNRCVVDTFARDFKYEVTHISLAKAADLIMIAPATANVIAKMAHGIADDMLTTVVLAAKCKKLVSPAMNTAMLENPITQDNLATLKKYGFGCIFILPDGRIYTEYGNGDNPDSLKQRNVSGEMLGAMYAVRFALNSGFTVIEIRYDYEGIEKWVTGAWKSKNDLTKKYAQTMLGWGQKIQIRFTKVPAHSKVKYNELADETAKLGVANGNGIPKVKSLSDFEAADGVEA